MKYTHEERIDIGRDIYTSGMSCHDAMAKYNLSHGSVERYVSMYKAENGIKGTRSLSSENPAPKQPSKSRQETSDYDMEAYKAMSKEELIDELIRAKVNEARAKKGYEVKGDGASKEYSSLSNKNFK
jgi:transposase